LWPSAAAHAHITLYTWDHRNRLVGVTHYQTWSETDPVSDLEVRYVYDHHGLETSPLPQAGEGPGVRALGTTTSSANPPGVRAPGTTTPSANPPGLRAGEPILQFDGQGQLEKRHLHGPAVNQVLAEESLHEDAGSGQLLSS